MIVQQAALLLLEDGTALFGQALGARGTSMGELCFNTGMTGYQEVFTDPSYFGQIMVCTHSHIGNYGVHPAESESDGVKIAGLVCRNFSEQFSRADASGSLQDWLAAQGLVGIQGIDTRALVRRLRERGVMNAALSSEILEPGLLAERLAACPPMAGQDLAAAVSSAAPYSIGEGPRRIAVVNYGIKAHILERLAARGARLTVHPAQAQIADVLAGEPDGIFLSNGPGDPAAMPYAVQLAKDAVASGRPVFGICLGHQLLGLAGGAHTYKMLFGHRGLNHPVRNLATGHCEITSQNHGFGVDAESLAAAPALELTHVNLNDGSVEGLRFKGKPAFSVQYHPESNPGPHDSRYLFDDFFAEIEKAAQ